MPCTWPPSRSVDAGAAPRYGTCRNLTPADDANSFRAPGAACFRSSVEAIAMALGFLRRAAWPGPWPRPPACRASPPGSSVLRTTSDTGGEILERIVGRLVHQVRRDRDRADRRHEQRRPVRIGPRHIFGTDRPIGAGTVVDDDVLPEQRLRACRRPAARQNRSGRRPETPPPGGLGATAGLAPALRASGASNTSNVSIARSKRERKTWWFPPRAARWRRPMTPRSIPDQAKTNPCPGDLSPHFIKDAGSLKHDINKLIAEKKLAIEHVERLQQKVGRRRSPPDPAVV